MPPFAVKKFDHLVLRVSDVERAIKFYVDVLGCTVDRRRPELGLYHLRLADFLIDLVDIHGQIGGDKGAVTLDTPRNLDHFCLLLEDFDGDKLTAFFDAMDIEVSEPNPRYGAEGVALSLYIDDPDGNTIELKSPGAEA